MPRMALGRASSRPLSVIFCVHTPSQLTRLGVTHYSKLTSANSLCVRTLVVLSKSHGLWVRQCLELLGLGRLKVAIDGGAARELIFCALRSVWLTA